MDKVKTACGFVLLFTGVGYLAMWALLFSAAALFGIDERATFLSPSMHAAGVVAATLTISRFLVFLRNRPRRQIAPKIEAMAPPGLSLRRRPRPRPLPVEPRQQFGLRRMQR